MDRLSQNLILSAYFNHVPDPQRRRPWAARVTDLEPLARSVYHNDAEILFFHNCFTEDNTRHLRRIASFVRVTPDPAYQPSVYRWFSYLEYLSAHYHPYVFMVDSTDVEMLRNPFPELQPGVLYCGDEYNRRLTAPYIQEKRHYVNDPALQSFLDTHRRYRLLNAGICGGDYRTVVCFLKALTSYHSQNSRHSPTSTDMPIFNYIARKHFNAFLEHGPHVNTRFKKFEHQYRAKWPHRWIFPLTPWWKHK